MPKETKDTNSARQPLPLSRLLPPLSTANDGNNDDASNISNNKSNRVDIVRVYLIRHGQTDWNLEGRIQGGGFDIPLNETGKLQARLTAKALEGIPLDVVASSPLSRARETADILMETMLLSGSNNNNNDSSNNYNQHNHLIRRIVDLGFTEMKFGALEGLRYKAITEKEDYDRFLAIKQRVVDDPDYRFPASSSVDPWEKKKEREHETEHETKTNDSDSERTRPVTVSNNDNDNCEGESTRIVQERSLEALSRALDRTNNNNNNNDDNDSDDDNNNGRVRHVAIVAHARTNKVLIAAMLYGEAHGRFPQIQQGNVNISVLDFHDDPDYSCNDNDSNNDNDNDSNSNASGKSKSSTDIKDTRGCWKSRILNYTEHVADAT